MSSLVSSQKCCCNCHQEDGHVFDYRKYEERFQKNPFLIGWEEFLNKFASDKTVEDPTETSSETSTFSGEENDDILTNEENELQFRLRMRQRQGYWNGLKGEKCQNIPNWSLRKSTFDLQSLLWLVQYLINQFQLKILFNLVS